MSELQRIPDIAVPVSLVQRPEVFGGGLQGDLLIGDLLVSGGRVTGLARRENARCSRIVTSYLTEAHCHLDKCHSVDRIPTSGGDLAAALVAQKNDKRNWNHADITNRAEKGLAELRTAGCGTVRSHVDWLAPGEGVPEAWHVLAELAPNAGLALQVAALAGIDEYAEPGHADALARFIAPSGGVLGGFVLDHCKRREGLRACFAAAEKYGLALDFHVDEGLTAKLDGLDLIVEIAEETNFEGPILCSHACALMNRSADDLARIGGRMARAGISLAVLPATNLYLQGRRAGTPDRRGIAPIHELRAAGVRVIIATDNVADAFQPGGRHDPRAALALASIACHLDPPLGLWLSAISTDARRALGLHEGWVDGASINDLVAFEAVSTTALVTRAPQPFPANTLIAELTS